VALEVAAALAAVCGGAVQPEVDHLVLPPLAYPAAAVVAAAIAAEQVTPAWATAAGRVAVRVGAGYDLAVQRQIVLAVAKVWHGLGEVHTPAIRALEQATCPLPPPVAAWPWELEPPVLAWLAAAAAWTAAGRPPAPGLAAALSRLAARAGGAARGGTAG
jgi:hypothetical protein